MYYRLQENKTCILKMQSIYLKDGGIAVIDGGIDVIHGWKLSRKRSIVNFLEGIEITEFVMN